MRVFGKILRDVLIGLLIFVGVGKAFGQESPEMSYRKLVTPNLDISPLGEDPFFEQLSLQNGALGFLVPDVQLKGIGPDIEIYRSFAANDTYWTDQRLSPSFGDWRLEIPRITTTVYRTDRTVVLSFDDFVMNAYQWEATGASPGARCNDFGPPPGMPGGGSFRAARSWWHGARLIVPGKTNEQILKAVSGSLRPNSSHPLVTKDKWAISCLGQLASGQPGEGFLATSPDGTKYYFDWLVFDFDKSLVLNSSYLGCDELSSPDGCPLNIARADMLVTKIVDRFGNHIVFNYDRNRLTSITASDGRQALVNWRSDVAGPESVKCVVGCGDRSPDPRWPTNAIEYIVDTIVMNPASAGRRTIAYSYAVWDRNPFIEQNYPQNMVSLTGVTLPDGSSWGIDFRAIHGAATSGHMHPGNAQYSADDCGLYGVEHDFGQLASIRHPSGLNAQYFFKRKSHLLRNAPSHCNTNPTIKNDLASIFVTDVYANIALAKKTYQGAQVNSTWVYAYTLDPWNLSTATQYKNAGMDDSTRVVKPDGSSDLYDYSNLWGITLGDLKSVRSYSGSTSNTTLLKTATYSHTSSSQGAGFSRVGASTQSFDLDNVARLEDFRPLTRVDLLLEGDTYTWQVEAFNSFAQISRSKRFNSITGQLAIQSQHTYLNALPDWVLGLPLRTDNLTTGETVSENEYHPSSFTLSKRFVFGQEVMSYSFNTAGLLASFTDGNSKTTNLSNYKRGVPQAVGHPDGSNESFEVDDFGQITSVTNQVGRTTNYTYDAAGRVTRIDYPTGDVVAWLPTTFAYDFVANSERGLSANHWRRTTTTGSAKKVTYFDALLRPVINDSMIGSAVQASTLTTYDKAGNKAFVSYPEGTAVTYSETPGSANVLGRSLSYDALGRITQARQDSELGVLTDDLAYLPGARRKVTDAKGNVTTTSYLVFESPSYDMPIKVEAPAGITQNIARDVYGNPTSMTQSGQYGTETNSVTKTLVYDSRHRLCRTSEPEGGSSVMAYDGADNLAWSAAGLAITGTACGYEQVMAGAKTTRTYDAMNRVTLILPPAGTQSTAYGYDPAGRLTSAVSGISTWNASYNYRGLLTGESLLLAGQNAWGIGYAHDAYGNVSFIQYPDGESVSYAPDPLGRPSRVGNYATGVQYFPNGEVKEFTYGNGAFFLAEQTARLLPLYVSYELGNMSVVSEGYTYDANGNTTKIEDLAGGPRSKIMSYDALNRLASANAAGLWGTQSYTYDALNNVRTLQTGGQVSTYHYDTTNKLASISSGGATLASYFYDLRGNVSRQNTTDFVFDQKNQLTLIQGVGSYAYDAAGRRVLKAPDGGGAPTYYFYNQAGRLMHQMSSGANKTTNFVYLGRKLVARNESLYLVAPGAVSFDANPNNGSYMVSWSAVPGATSYLLQESANGGGWTTVYSGAATSAALSGRAGGNYVYQVEGCAGTTCGAWATSATLGVRPALPTITVPTGTINGNYTVSWTTPACATGYDVQERVDGGAWTTIASNTAATAISRPGTSSGSYTYQVSAKNAYGSRGWAASAAVTVDTAYGVVPDMPASLTVPASSSTGSATLSWSTTSLATSYTLQQSGNGGVSWSTAYTGSATSAALAGLADGSYVYQVQACNTYGCSAWKAGSTTLVVTHPPTTAPTISAPASSASGSYTVSWSGVPGPVSYTLQEQVNGGAWATVQANGTTSWGASGKGNGSYGYRVQACNVGGCGPWSSTGTTTVLLSPAAPSSITVPATSSGSIAVSWAASATATSYTLQQRLGAGSWGTIYTGAATSSTRTVTTSGSYTYQVQACNTGGCSAYTASSAVAVTIPPATAPALSVPATNNTGSYAVSWGGVSGATSYTLQEQVNGGAWATAQASSATSWNASGKGSGTYGYQVQACNVGGCGPWSATGSITVTVIPAAPARPSTSVSGPSNKPVVKVTWSAVDGATSYQLEETHPQDGVDIVYNGSATSWSQLIFATGTVQFRVKACNSVGCSAFSEYKSVGLNSGLGLPLAEPVDTAAEEQEVTP